MPRNRPFNDRPSRPKDDYDTDVEKRFYRYDEDDSPCEYEDHDYSEASSRSVSSSHIMLADAFPNRPSRRLMRFPNCIMRYICWGVAIAILLFMLSLVRMSWDADKAVKMAGMKNKLITKPPLWTEFPTLDRYWGGLRSLTPYTDNKPEYPTEHDGQDQAGIVSSTSTAQRKPIPDSMLFDPYPSYTSKEYTAKYGKKVDCYLDQSGKIDIPQVRMYEGRTEGFPEPVIGSAELLGMKHDICYDRFGRFGPYGLGYALDQGGSGAMEKGEREGADAVWKTVPQVNFARVKWKEVQDRCFLANQHRFNMSMKPPAERFRTMHVGESATGSDAVDAAKAPAKVKNAGRSKVQRTAIVIRTWHDYDYSTEDLLHLRSLVAELSLLSGGEYSLHFLIHVRDDNAPIWTDEKMYERFLNDALPEEFKGMGTLWTEKQMLLMYPNLEESWARNLPVHGVYRSSFLPMQYFAYQHPEYDFFWNWEMDVRNTGHWYHLFDSVSKWAKQQPRKYLWERNSRFYIPATHGTWDEFNHTVRVQTDRGTTSPNNLWSSRRPSDKATGSAQMSGDIPVWGPLRPQDDDVVFDTDSQPPTTMDKDRYEWGVGEDADLITFNPIFDPTDTTWLLADDTTGYNLANGRPPRRAAIIAASRLSRKLLMTMHRETSQLRHTMFSEMWPASAALHHGLKAVYAPHAEYIDRRWPLEYLRATFNAGRNEATGASRTSVFGEREHNFKGTTWYYDAEFPRLLWQRWLGMEVEGRGGEESELQGEGRMCLPGMLLHPIKRVNLPVRDTGVEPLSSADDDDDDTK